MSERVNKTYPYEEDGVTIETNVDELMLKYYRVNGELHREAFSAGQRLIEYFAAYGVVIMNATVPEKVTLPNIHNTLMGFEAPFTLILDNSFYQNNFQVIVAAVLNEMARMNTARALGKEVPAIQYALGLCRFEFLSVIALLVGGTNAQRGMDVELRKSLNKDVDKLVQMFRQRVNRDVS